MKSSKNGLLIGAVLTLVLTALSLYAILSANIGYGIYILIVIAAVVCGPLVLFNIGVSAYLVFKTSERRVLLWIWLPPIAAAAIIPVFSFGHQLWREAFQLSHPNIREVHVNLTGRTLWLDPESTVNDPLPAMQGSAPDQFSELTRYSEKYYGVDRMQAYKGVRLADSFKKMQVFYGDPASTAPTILPVVIASPYPDLTELLSKLDFMRGNEAAVMVYLYHHYTDRIEVSPSFELAGSQTMDLKGKNVPVVAFHLHNRGLLPIARVEIDGLALHLGSGAVAPASCGGRAADSINHLLTPLKVRWQFAQPNQTWQTAEVTVPTFKSAKSTKGKVSYNQVDLYFQDQAAPVAERSQEITLGNGQLGIRTTGPNSRLMRSATCGTAVDRYADVVVRLPE